MQNKVAEAKKAVEINSFDDMRTSFNATLNSNDMLSSQDQKKLQDLSKKGLPVYEMIHMEKEGSVLIHNGDRNSFLIKVDKIEPFDQNRFLELEKDVRDHLGPIRTKLLLDGAIASLHRNATIETNESILIAGKEYSE